LEHKKKIFKYFFYIRKNFYKKQEISNDRYNFKVNRASFIIVCYWETPVQLKKSFESGAPKMFEVTITVK